jgi:hypothetical protein
MMMSPFYDTNEKLHRFDLLLAAVENESMPNGRSARQCAAVADKIEELRRLLEVEVRNMLQKPYEAAA